MSSKKVAVLDQETHELDQQEESKDENHDEHVNPDSEEVRAHDQEYASVSRKLESEADEARSPNKAEAKTPAEHAMEEWSRTTTRVRTLS